jgi:hypothetical protein
MSRTSREHSVALLFELTYQEMVRNLRDALQFPAPVCRFDCRMLGTEHLTFVRRSKIASYPADAAVASALLLQFLRQW